MGPTESYDDSIAGVKEYYHFALYSQDNQGAEIIGKFAGMSQEMGRNLPLEERYNPYLKDPDFKPARNMAAVNMIAGGGDSRTYAAAGWTLPNEPEIAAKHGTKMLLIRNVIATRGSDAMRFVQRRLFGEAYDPDIFYWMVAGHELSHGMLPFTKGYDPKGQPLSQILGDLDLPVEEKKADLLGLMAVEEFAKKGEISWDSYWAIARMYVGAETVFRLYRNPNEAHAKYSVAVHNLLKEKHAVSFDGATGRMQVHSNFPQAIREILSIFLKIQAEGDRGAAERLLSEHNAPAPEITAAIEALKKAGLSSQTHYNPIISQ
ncbi:MAG: hypothetical protein A3G41_02990 [Elusimicrobia bacterium RIFCSPLOWO2_12_FULL_59_9]|nr:MAG: hypothetical protein A3G41_02990 [Elusimicrobia bacterium RIFCSPLOWO2_12_FULL_59_9]